jgi:hypothetical protein
MHHSQPTQPLNCWARSPIHCQACSTIHSRVHSLLNRLLNRRRARSLLNRWARKVHCPHRLQYTAPTAYSPNSTAAGLAKSTPGSQPNPLWRAHNPIHRSQPTPLNRWARSPIQLRLTAQIQHGPHSPLSCRACKVHRRSRSPLNWPLGDENDTSLEMHTIL